MAKAVYIAPYQLANLVPDGMMEPGSWSGGAQDASKVAFGHYSFKMAGVASQTEALINSIAGISLIPSHIYYAAIHAWQDTKSGSIDIYWPIAEPSFMAGQQVPETGKWCRVSGRNGRSSFGAGSYQIRFDYNNGFVAGTMWFDGPMLIDLTAEFGSGNEPTKEWCDENIILSAGGQPFVRGGA